MRLGRRLLALSLNLLLLQASWTGSRGACAPMAEPDHDSHAMAMPAAAGSSASIESAGAPDHGCSADMLGADCGLMAGCATASAMAAVTPQATPMIPAPARFAFARTSISAALPQPEPPPPRA